MNGALSERLSDDRRLLKLNSEAEMDDRMEETGEGPAKHIVGLLIASEQVLLDDGLPPKMVDLLPKELQEIVIVSLIPEVAFELRWVGHVTDDGALYGFGGSLVGLIDVESLLDVLGPSAQSPEGEQMVRNVIVKAIAVEENVVFLVIPLKKV